MSVHNCGINAVCAITGLRPGHIRLVPELDEFQTRIIEETVALVPAKGIEPPGPAPGGAPPAPKTRRECPRHTASARREAGRRGPGPPNGAPQRKRKRGGDSSPPTE